MVVPASKAELLEAIDTNFDKLIVDLWEVPLTMVDECSFEGHAQGTNMSVANLAAYLVGWNQWVLKWLYQDAAGETVDFPETGFKWSELGRLAQKFYGDYTRAPYPQLIERLAGAEATIVSLIEARSNDDLYGRSWYGKWITGRMIQFNTSSPYANARGRLRKWLGGKAKDI